MEVKQHTLIQELVGSTRDTILLMVEKLYGGILSYNIYG